MKIVVCILFFLFPILTSQVHAQAPADSLKPQSPQTLDALKATIEKIRKETNTPAVGIALVSKDGPYWLAGLGEANLEKHVKADENTLFRIGSVSKMFVGLAVLKLVEAGKLHLDDKLSALAPEIEFKNPWETSRPVLLAHLLEHTTGWEDGHLVEAGFKAPDNISLKDDLAFHPHSRVSRWMPGSRYAYCNSGPVVAAYIVEKISGKKFEDYMQETFFTPLQMPTTSYFETENVKRLGVKQYAGGQVEAYRHELGRPSGSINSSAREMANFLQLLILRGQFGGHQLLSASSIDRMEQGKTTTGAAKGILHAYGIASHAYGYDGYQVPFYGHTGHSGAGLTRLAYAPSLQQGFVIMLSAENYDAESRMSAAIQKFLLKDAVKKALPDKPLPPAFQQLDGWYQQINPRYEVLRYIADVMSYTRFSIVGNKLQRTSLFEGDESEDGAYNEQLLMDADSGLPKIAIVNDPLAGEAVQIESDLYKRLSPLHFYGLLALLGTWLVFVLLNFVMAAITGLRRIAGKGKPIANARLLFMPVLASLILIWFKNSGAIFGNTAAQWGSVSATSLNVMIGSLAYAAVSLYCLWLAFQQIRMPAKRYAHWYASILSVLHTGIVVYLLCYGIIGIRTWT